MNAPLDPTELRAAIASTREDLARHLASLRAHFLSSITSHHVPKPDPQGDKTAMATKKPSRKSNADARPSEPRTASAKTAARRKTTASSKSVSSSAGRSPRRKKSEGLVAQTGAVLDTMVAGAVVGAITGAAQSLQNEPAAVHAEDMKAVNGPESARSPGTGEVLSEMAGGAAAGAVTGAARSIMPKKKK